MHLRKVLTLGAAVLAAGLLSLNPTSQASSPTGGNIASVWVDLVGTTAAIPVNATLDATSRVSYGGTGSFSCTMGSIPGSANRGPVTAASEMAFSFPTFTCAAPWGPSTFTGCSVSAKFTDPNVHSGIIDTGTGTKISRVDGSAWFTCSTFSSGLCNAAILSGGNVAAYFDEANQRLILNGPSLSFYMQSAGCFGLLTSFDLNNLTLNVQVTGGATTGIDFRP